jgi:hypothetical protein
MMHFTGLQVRAARALLRITAEQLAKLASVSVVTVRRAELEDGPVAMTAASAFAVQKALAEAGVIFIDAEAGIGGPGVRLKLGVDPSEIRKALSEEKTSDKPDSGLHSRAWDDEFDDAAISEAELSEDDRQLLEYIRTAPHLSDRGREVLMRGFLERGSAQLRLAL